MLMWWYTPSYHITPAPLDYHLSSQSAYSYWQGALASDHIVYVIHVDPTSAIQSNMPMLHRAFSYSSSQSSVVVYSVS